MLISLLFKTLIPDWRCALVCGRCVLFSTQLRSVAACRGLSLMAIPPIAIAAGGVYARTRTFMCRDLGLLVLFCASFFARGGPNFITLKTGMCMVTVFACPCYWRRPTAGHGLGGLMRYFRTGEVLMLFPEPQQASAYRRLIGVYSPFLYILALNLLP